MSFVTCIYHLVFAPKNRKPVIITEKEREVYSILVSILRKNGCFVHRVGGMPDHVHILLDIPPTTSISSIIQKLKRESSTIIRDNSILPAWDGWQNGYGLFSCSYEDKESVRQYIMNQKEHHKKVRYIDELRRWLINNGIPENAPFFPD